MEKDDKKNSEEKDITTGEQGRASFHPGSTTQGGSNHGQGSMHLGKDANKQGSEKNKGSNYDNEEGFNEAKDQ